MTGARVLTVFLTHICTVVHIHTVKMNKQCYWLQRIAPAVLLTARIAPAVLLAAKDSTSSATGCKDSTSSATGCKDSTPDTIVTAVLLNEFQHPQQHNLDLLCSKVGQSVNALPRIRSFLL